jgi:hypothetical protein
LAMTSFRASLIFEIVAGSYPSVAPHGAQL